MALGSGDPTVARLPHVRPGEDPVSLPVGSCLDPADSTSVNPRLSGDLEPDLGERPPACKVDILAVPFSRCTKLLGPEMTPLLILGDLLPDVTPTPARPCPTSFELSGDFDDFAVCLSSDRLLEPSPRNLEPPENHPKPFQPDPELPLWGTVRCCLDVEVELELGPCLKAEPDACDPESRSFEPDPGPKKRCSERKLPEVDIPFPEIPWA